MQIPFNAVLALAALIFAATSVGLAPPASAGVTLSGCQALFERGRGPGRLRIGEGQQGNLNAVIGECNRRYGDQFKDIAGKRKRSRADTARLLSDTVETMTHQPAGRKHRKRDRVKEGADHSYAVGESLLRTMTGLSQRKNPWDSLSGHGGGGKRRHR